MRHTARPKNLFNRLLCLTGLFVFGQLAFFYPHYHVAELIDSLTRSSILPVLLRPVILVPVLQFVFIQVVAYILFVSWIWFVSVSLGALFRLSADATGWSSILVWFLGCIFILLLNHCYFPDSFFAAPFHYYAWIDALSHFLLMGLGVILLLMTLLAYVYFFWRDKNKRSGYVITGYLLLLIGTVLIAICLGDKYYLSRERVHQPSLKPNIILIGLDSLRPDFTGFLGNKRVHTPHIDQFMRQATLFTQGYTPLARTFPAWMSILTARYPKHHRARNNLADPSTLLAQTTLATRLQQAGYETIYATDEKRFSNITKQYGFDRIIGPRMGANDFLIGGLNDFPLSNLLIRLPIGRWIFPYNYGNRAASITYEPDSFLQLINAGLAEPADKPVMLAVHLCLTHWPYTWARDGQEKDLILSERYRSSVSAVDAQLGKLLRLLKAKGLLENSLVVLLSDHGTALGLPDDRIVAKEKYQGDQRLLSRISVSRLNTATPFSANFKKDYSIGAAYGQGNDVLSLKQSHVLIAFKGYGLRIPSQRVNEAVSLMDVAPTILDWLGLPPLKPADGLSLKNYLLKQENQAVSLRPLFMETGDRVAEAEGSHINIQNVLGKRISAYSINLNNGLLTLNAAFEQSILKNKQRAMLMGDWLLAHYPRETRLGFVPVSPAKPDQLTLKPYDIGPYFVLVNVRTGKWTIGLSSPFAKSAPLAILLREFNQFYGEEVQILQ